MCPVHARLEDDTFARLRRVQLMNHAGADDQDIDGSVQFAGEDIPWHEMYIVNNAGEGEASLIAHEDGSVTTYELASNGSTEGTVEYD